VSEDKGERESKVATPAVLQQIKDFKGLNLPALKGPLTTNSNFPNCPTSLLTICARGFGEYKLLKSQHYILAGAPPAIFYEIIIIIQSVKWLRESEIPSKIPTFFERLTGD
jgi:hypothetical protein